MKKIGSNHRDLWQLWLLIWASQTCSPWRAFSTLWVLWWLGSNVAATYSKSTHVDSTIAGFESRRYCWNAREVPTPTWAACNWCRSLGRATNDLRNGILISGATQRKSVGVGTTGFGITRLCSRRNAAQSLESRDWWSVCKVGESRHHLSPYNPSLTHSNYTLVAR